MSTDWPLLNSLSSQDFSECRSSAQTREQLKILLIETTQIPPRWGSEHWSEFTCLMCEDPFLCLGRTALQWAVTWACISTCSQFSCPYPAGNEQCLVSRSITILCPIFHHIILFLSEICQLYGSCVLVKKENTFSLLHALDSGDSIWILFIGKDALNCLWPSTG